ncbi:metalloregulator ArsR/SmtB family transcription factor [Shewanella algae]|uniref:ArsR/SmtB family transcription factor n=1 Tax=Shewanella algae TaxID=38313 RepID=UPI0031F48FE8
MSSDNLTETQGQQLDSHYRELADIAKVLSHGHRLRLLEQIAQGEWPVERLAQQCGLTLANCSQHLQQLKRAGMVDSRREGKQVLYSLADGPLLVLLQSLAQLADFQRSRVNQLVARHKPEPGSGEGVSREALLAWLESGDVLLLDVRPEEEFLLGHLPGALNLPLPLLEAELARLPKHTEIVAYCRGPYCALSDEAVALLQAQGFNAKRLNAGFPDWKAAGLVVEV